MRIIDIGENRYYVIRELRTLDDDFMAKIKEIYGRYNDFVLLKGPENPTTPEHYLVCRRIDDAEFEEIVVLPVPAKKKRASKKSKKIKDDAAPIIQ